MDEIINEDVRNLITRDDILDAIAVPYQSA
jgi:hypothetical protein